MWDFEVDTCLNVNMIYVFNQLFAVKGERGAV